MRPRAAAGPVLLDRGPIPFAFSRPSQDGPPIYNLRVMGFKGRCASAVSLSALVTTLCPRPAQSQTSPPSCEKTKRSIGAHIGSPSPRASRPPQLQLRTRSRRLHIPQSYLYRVSDPLDPYAMRAAAHPFNAAARATDVTQLQQGAQPWVCN